MTGVTVRAHSGGGNASGSTITYTFPGTPQVGDPIGIWVTTDNNAITIPSPPTGWTLAYSTTVGTGSRHFLHKVYASGDGASVAVTYSAAIGLNHSQAAVVVFDGSVHSDFGTIGTVTTRGSSSNTSTAVAAGATTDPNIVVFHEKTTSESSCTVGSATAIENLLPAAAIAGATYVGWYDTSGGTSTITATYGLSSANGCGYQIPLTLVPVTSSGSASLSLSGAQGNTGGGAIALAGAGAGAAPVTATATLTLTGSQTTPVQRWKRLPLPLAAHRGGSADWPEETLFAYGNCVAWNSDLALEISVWRSSDGVWVCSHDQNTSRVFGSSFDIPTSTWASMSGLTTTVGGKPIAKLTDVLDAYATGNRVIFIDNKGTQDLPGFLTLLNGYGGPARFVIKNFYTNATIAAWATTNGFESWGYWFPADTAGGNLNATTAGRWTMLGIEFDDTSAIWSQALGYGKPVLGHIIATTTQAAAATGLGATGLMVSGVQEVVTNDSATGTASLALTGAGAGRSLAGGSATLALGALAIAAARAGGSAALALGGLAIAAGRAGGSAAITLSAVGTAADAGAQRDLTIVVTVGADRWTVGTGADRWTISTGADRWTITTTKAEA
jgi:hypothetical protein